MRVCLGLSSAGVGIMTNRSQGAGRGIFRSQASTSSACAARFGCLHDARSPEAAQPVLDMKAANAAQAAVHAPGA